MRKILILTLMVLCCTVVAQSPRQMFNSVWEEETLFLSPSFTQSPASAWGGAELVHEFGFNKLDSLSNTQFHGKVLANLLNTGNVSVPLMSTVEFSSDQFLSGVDLGAYPWQSLSDLFVAYGEISFATDGDFEDYSFRLGAGGEVSLPTTYLPLTANIFPVLTLFKGGDAFFGIETAITVPVADGLGLLGRVNFSLDEDYPTSAALGLIVAGVL